MNKFLSTIPTDWEDLFSFIQDCDSLGYKHFFINMKKYYTTIVGNGGDKIYVQCYIDPDKKFSIERIANYISKSRNIKNIIICNFPKKRLTMKMNRKPVPVLIRDKVSAEDIELFNHVYDQSTGNNKRRLSFASVILSDDYILNGSSHIPGNVELMVQTLIYQMKESYRKRR